MIFKNTDRERKDLKRDVFEKMTAVMLALALAVSTLTGCGDRQNNTGENSQTVSEEGVTEDNSGSFASDDTNTEGPDGGADQEIDYSTAEGKHTPDQVAVDLSAYPRWNLIEAIDVSSFKTNEDGTMYFEVKGPDGNPIRFWGEDVEVTENTITFHTYGRIMMLDSVGRIYGACVNYTEPGDSPDYFGVFPGYDVNGDLHPGKLDNMVYYTGFTAPVSYGDLDARLLNYDPNFLGFGVSNPDYKKGDYILQNDVVVDSIYLRYNPDAGATPFEEVRLFIDSYGAYVEGEKYDPSKEVYKPYEGLGYFELYGFPELEYKEFAASEIQRETIPYGYGICVSNENIFSVGDIKDAAGNILDKEKDPLPVGATVTVNVGSTSYDVSLEVLPKYRGAKTMHDLVPDAYPNAVGNLNVLVVPIGWNDEKENATEEAYEAIMSELGRVARLGTGEGIVDHSDGTPDGRYSLSRYFDMASYGKLKVNSYITDWFISEENFSDMMYSFPIEDVTAKVSDWLYGKYSDVDFSMFDLDKNGYADVTVFINIGDMSGADGFSPISFGGGCQYRHTYGNEYAGTSDKPALINNIVNVNTSLLKDNTLLHEFSHGFGLIDYYDVSYTGIDAVGGFDMQSDSHGDWNPYSKYAVGWIEPTVVKGLNPGESVDIEIGAFEDTGDAIAIPYAGEDVEPPFCEYMLVDLFTDSGVNAVFAKEHDMAGACGIRMYHVDAVMEKRNYVNQYFPDMAPCPIGTVHYGNNYKPNGRYNLELIQAGRKNTFTDLEKLDTNFKKKDLFKAGDTFTLSKYSEFFDGGLMDSGTDFGYSIKVVSITGTGADARAVIRVTRE